MTDHEFLAACGLSPEWGVRRVTHVGLVDQWLVNEQLAQFVAEDEEAEGAVLIKRWVSTTFAFNGAWTADE